jgi:5-methylcytosine-specific restriction endonuclease McrA
MSMTANYQPVIIRELLKRNGEATKDELALALLIEDRDTFNYWRKVLMTWPKSTLVKKHAIIQYCSKTKSFLLPFDLSDQGIVKEVVDMCDEKISKFGNVSPKKLASLRYKLIEQAKGICQACGAVPSSDNPLDIDHIVPRSKSKNGKVKNSLDESVDVDDESNLQVLCAKCNRGKRDSGSYNFKPSAKRIEDALSGIISLAQELGLDISLMIKQMGIESEQI